MKGIKRESNVHLRISKQEKNKYNKIANDIGLTLSAFTQYGMAKTSGIINQVKKEF